MYGRIDTQFRTKKHFSSDLANLCASLDVCQVMCEMTCWKGPGVIIKLLIGDQFMMCFSASGVKSKLKGHLPIYKQSPVESELRLLEILHKLLTHPLQAHCD